MDLNNQYLKDIEALNATMRQYVGDREVTDKVILEKDEQIKTLNDTISVAMDIDTEDVEVLKRRLAEKTVGFDHLESIINSLRAENAA
eukprot:12773698-Heterocapsa_arctica.AAC.1